MADNRRELAAGAAVAQRAFVNDGLLGELVDQVATALRADMTSTSTRHQGGLHELATA